MYQHSVMPLEECKRHLLAGIRAQLDKLCTELWLFLMIIYISTLREQRMIAYSDVLPVGKYKSPTHSAIALVNVLTHLNTA